jgi:hypothetical protein
MCPPAVDHSGKPVRHLEIPILPTGHLGRWAVGLSAAFLPLVFLAAAVPLAAALGFLCGLSGGAAALVAIVRERERAVLVFAALAPFAVALAFLLAELVSGIR